MIRQAVVLVGGMGKRLAPLTDALPKPMMPVLERPFLDYSLESLRGSGITEAVLACGYMADSIKERVHIPSGLSVRFSVEEHPLGTAGALKNLEDILDDRFLVVNGDIYFSSGLGGFFTSASKDISMCVIEADNPSSYGVVSVDKTGIVTDFEEKPESPKSNLVNAGIYLMNRRILSHVPMGVQSDIAYDLIPGLMGAGIPIDAYRISGEWMDIGRPRDLIRINQIFGRSKGRSCGGVLYAGSGSRIIDSVVSESVVFSKSEIYRSALSSSLILSGSEIHCSEVRNSIIGEGCKVGKGCIIVDSVLPSGTVLPDDTRLDSHRL